MDTIRFGEALLRQCIPLLPSPTTACNRTITRQYRFQCLASSVQRNQSRTFGSSTHRHAEDDAPIRSTRTPQGRVENDEISRIINNSFGTLRSRSNNNLAEDGPRRGGNSVSDLMLSALGSVGKNKNKRNVTASDPQSEFNVEQMLNPNATPSSLRDRLPPTIPDDPLPFKLGPSVGRMIPVDAARNMDIGRAFRQLEIVCNRNKVKQDFMKQRFHERPGLKRKRLKTVRWRRRFKEGFKGIVKKVMGMKKQGW
nr:37s ribosomal protein mrp21, mitochondrial [Quercus suber]